MSQKCQFDQNAPQQFGESAVPSVPLAASDQHPAWPAEAACRGVAGRGCTPLSMLFMTATGAPYGGYMCVGEEVVIAPVGHRVVDPETTLDYRSGDPKSLNAVTRRVEQLSTKCFIKLNLRRNHIDRSALRPTEQAP
jgi:hypothetical protein